MTSGGETGRRRPVRKPLLLAGGGLAAGFLIWTLATLQRPEPAYGDPDRVPSGTGAALSLPSGGDSDWTYFGRDPGGSQWSPLDQINRDNVAGLKVAWTHNSGDFRVAPGYKGTSYEPTPLIVGDTLYYCTPFDRVFALDATTGAERWVFDPRAATKGQKPLFRDEMKQKHCRGMAYWKDTLSTGGLCSERLFRAAGDLAIVAMDAKTGQACPDFGADKGRQGYVTHLDFEAHGLDPVPASSPPIVVGDVLVAAAGARDSHIDAADGIVRGFDVRSGKLLWEFNPIPPEHSDKTGAANVWSLLSADPGRGHVYLATTTPSPDYYGGTRAFDLPLTNAVVAVSVADGKPVWHYQIVRHDVFDYDLPSHPLVVSIRKDGKLRDVVIQQTKMGMIFVLDRDTGKPVFPVREMAVPQSRVKGEKLSPTQPVPTGIAQFARTELSAKEIFGITPLDRAWCRNRFESLRYEGIFTPPDPQGALTFPSALGGGNWGGAAYDPGTNLLIVKASNLATTIYLRPQPDGPSKPSTSYLARVIPQVGLETDGDDFMSPVGVPCTPPPWGTLTAIDMDSGKRVWQVPLGQSKRYGITVPSWMNWGSPAVGGPTVTAGGLVFVGATLDEKIRAFDVRTGRELWKGSLPAPGMAVPATYSVGGRQFVTIAAGGNAIAGTKLGDAMVTFALPEKK